MLLSHEMIRNALAWWHGVDASLDNGKLDAMIVHDFREIFEAQFVLDTIREWMRDQFMELHQGVMGVHAYAKHFIELSMFILENVTTDALRVGYFRHGL